ncbi:hypothetical protein [Ralstonia phage RSP15]|uniref:hypothetical protein n=1 Tax=Ralstonia phage RSP15 TaxID=1785960 RepID=UPI00074D358E|nr:hypothetical protein BH754_gp033 [Ralstonia phage RSP15]BAU39991.1 hypothetical protein [Ralstonia phage RSP15]
MELKDIVNAILEGKEEEALTMVKAHLTEQSKELVKQGRDFIAQSLFESEDDEDEEDDDEEDEDDAKLAKQDDEDEKNPDGENEE